MTTPNAIVFLLCCLLAGIFLARAYGYIKDIRDTYWNNKQNYERKLLEEKWSKPVVWGIQVKGNVCTFLAEEASFYRKFAYTTDAVLEAVPSYEVTDKARIDGALRFLGVKPRVANEYALPGRTDYAQEWYFPLPECFDSSRCYNGWFYIRGEPNWDVKVPLREGGIKLPKEEKP